MNKTYLVRLTDDARQGLLQLTKRGKAAASQIKHAPIFLHVDANGPNWSDAHVAQALPCHGNTVRNVRQRLVVQGLEAALMRKKQRQPSRQRLLAGAKDALLIALRCGPPPLRPSHVDPTVAGRPTRRPPRGGDYLLCNSPTDAQKN
jgi:hypothetical protein